MKKNNDKKKKNEIFEKIDKVLNKFRENEKESEKLLENSEKTNKKLDEALEKVKTLGKGPFKEVLEDFVLMILLVRAYIKKDYRSVPWKTIVAIFAAILYVINPFDVIPDVIPGVAYIDDAFVVTMVAKQVHSDLQAFKEWREVQHN